MFKFIALYQNRTFHKKGSIALCLLKVVERQQYYPALEFGKNNEPINITDFYDYNKGFAVRFLHMTE